MSKGQRIRKQRAAATVVNAAFIEQLREVRPLIEAALNQPSPSPSLCECGVDHNQERYQRALNLCTMIEKCPMQLSPEILQPLKELMEWVIAMGAHKEQVN